MNAPFSLDGLAMARALRDTVKQHAAASEQARTLVPELVQALWDSGLMQWMNPREAGGREPCFRELIDTWQELAWQDGSVGWIGIANLPSARIRRRLPARAPASTRSSAANGNRVTLGGQFAPNGAGQSRRGRLPRQRQLELRQRHRALGIRRGRLHPDGRRPDADGRRRHAGDAGRGRSRASRSTSPTAGSCRD